MRLLAQLTVLALCCSCGKEEEDNDSGDGWGYDGGSASGGATSGGEGATGGDGSTGSGTTGGTGEPYSCGDVDGDGCDDCPIEGTSNPANDGDLKEFQYLVLEPEFVLVVVEKVSGVAERPAPPAQAR